MKGIAILLLIVVALCWLFPYISRWLKRKAQQKTNDFLEDYIRDAMGLPPRPGSKKERRQRKRAAKEEAGGTYYSRRRGSSYGREESAADMLRQYAEDVDFTETYDYSSDPERHTTEAKIKTEQQVSDAEWVEVKSDKKAGK